MSAENQIDAKPLIADTANHLLITTSMPTEDKITGETPLPHKITGETPVPHKLPAECRCNKLRAVLSPEA
jgi:hypothetical protein